MTETSGVLWEFGKRDMPRRYCQILWIGLDVIRRPPSAPSPSGHAVAALHQRTARRRGPTAAGAFRSAGARQTLNPSVHGISRSVVRCRHGPLVRNPLLGVNGHSTFPYRGHRQIPHPLGESIIDTGPGGRLWAVRLRPVQVAGADGCASTATALALFGGTGVGAPVRDCGSDYPICPMRDRAARKTTFGVGGPIRANVDLYSQKVEVARRYTRGHRDALDPSFDEAWLYTSSYIQRSPRHIVHPRQSSCRGEVAGR